MQAGGEDAHARVLNAMDSTAVRASFAPDKTSSFGGSSASIDFSELDAKVVRKAAFSPTGLPSKDDDDDPFLAHEPAKRPAFQPAPVPPAAAKDDPLASMLANAPAKRAAFSPTTAPALSSSSSFIPDDPLAAAASVPKRSAFDPSAGQSLLGSGAPQTTLPVDLPAARSSFQPASFSSAPSNPALDLLSNHSLPSRPAFNPSKSALSSSPLPFDEPAVPARPSFQPASFGAAAPAGAVDLSFPPSRPSFEPAKI